MNDLEKKMICSGEAEEILLNTIREIDILVRDIYGLVNGDNYLMNWITEWKSEFDGEGRKAVDAINQMKEDISGHEEGGKYENFNK